MKLLVLGATGPTGRLVVEYALDAGDTVTTLVRRPEALGDLADRVAVHKGDATSDADLTEAMAGQNAAISALGRGTSIRADRLFTRAADAVARAAEATHMSRIVWMSSYGVGATYADATLPQKLMYSTFLRNIYSDKAAAEQVLREAPLDRTIVYPSALTNGPAKASYRADDHVPMRGIARISRANVAQFMLEAVHSGDWSLRNVVITD